RPAGFGGKGIRTPDFQLAKLALYQLSYAPAFRIAECRLAIADFNPEKLSGLGSCFPGRFLTETKIPDVDLAIASGIWLFLQADQCGVARNARLTPVESIDRPAISPASLM